MNIEISKEEHDAIKCVAKEMRKSNEFWSIVAGKIGGKYANTLQFLFEDEKDEPTYESNAIEWNGDGYYVFIVSQISWMSKWTKVETMEALLQFGKQRKTVKYITQSDLRYD